MEILKKAIQEITEIKKMIAGGRKIVGPTENFFVALPELHKDQLWLRFRLSLILMQSMPIARFTAAMMSPLPESSFTIQAEMQNALVRMATVLDDELTEVIDDKNLQIQKNPKLYHRIMAVHDNSNLPNLNELQKLRKVRNSIAHDNNPCELNWEEIRHYADEVENALLYLDILNSKTNLRRGDVELSAVEKLDSNSEDYRRVLTVTVNQNETKFCEYAWTYFYY